MIKEQLLKEKLDWLSEIKTSHEKLKKFGIVNIKEGGKKWNQQFSKWSFLLDMLINLLENMLCCRFCLFWHLSKFRENIKYFHKYNSYIFGCALFYCHWWKQNMFLNTFFPFLFYIFHLKCSSFVTRKKKFPKLKEGLGYLSLTCHP